jgi:hypothetical protein
LYIGLRDVDETQKKTVAEAGADVIWGDSDRVVDFPGELQKRLEARDMSLSLVHLDLDALDKSVGKSQRVQKRRRIAGCGCRQVHEFVAEESQAGFIYHVLFQPKPG